MAPERRPKLTQPERVQLSEARLLESAIRLVVERGVIGTRLTEVGLQAGYSRGLAAMRFGTKAGLLARIVRQGQTNWAQRLRIAVGDRTGFPAVHAAIEAQDRALIESALEMRAIYTIFFSSSDPSAEYHADVARMLAAQRRDLVRWFDQAREARQIATHVDPATVAGQVLSAMLGIVYQWVMDPTVPTHELHRGIQHWLNDWLDPALSRRVASVGGARGT